MTALTTSATCSWAGHDKPDGCGWSKDGSASDAEADKHTRTTGHATTVRSTPTTREG